MATTVTCDVCGSVIISPFLKGTLQVEVQEGPNHHNGDMDYQNVDFCESCFERAFALDKTKRPNRRQFLRLELSLSDLRKDQKERQEQFRKEVDNNW